METLEQRHVLATFVPLDVADLIAAINSANSNAESDVIELGGATFSLTQRQDDTEGANGLPPILPDGGHALTIREGTIQRLSEAPAFRILHVSFGVQLTLEGVAIQGGRAEGAPLGGFGGGILNRGELMLDRSVLAGNFAATGGGGIRNYNDLSVTRSVISGNTAADIGGGILSYFDLTVSDSTLAGNSAARGGGIYNRGTLELSGTTLVDNLAAHGGAVENRGAATLAANTISRNAAADEGGGIFNDGEMTVTASTLSENVALMGGGIFSAGGELTVAASLLSGNTADGGCGGGIYHGGGQLTVTESNLSANKANYGGGLYNGGEVALLASTWADNQAAGLGGGVFNGGFLTATSSTFFGNSSIQSGGAVANYGNADMIASTISGNTAGHLGGGLFNDGYLMITSGTITANLAVSGGGIASPQAPDYGSVTLRGVIVAGNFGDDPDLLGTFDAEFSLIGDIADAVVNASGPGENLIGGQGGPAIDALLGRLGDNGGPTLTHALLPESPAIDAAVAWGQTVDQRGLLRTVDVPFVEGPPSGDGTDIGAFELQLKPKQFAAARQTARNNLS